ncbi:hypothetical protein ACQR1I_28260 [Bradyrhizobium sp. HKCCYLS2038]|uniref:hypothetical protein n=1 Tax=unclassified Bradyrhizobium TaxID=2631580 RepID=UPI003EBC2BFE
MDFLLQIAGAAAMLAIFYMYEYWYVSLLVLFVGLVGMITSWRKGGTRSRTR